MFVDDLRFALLHCLPIQLARVHALDSILLRIFQVVPELGIEQQSLGWDAAHVQAGAAKIRILLDESGFQSVLAGSNSGRVSGRAAANYGDVINGVWQGRAPQLCMDELRQTNDSSKGGRRTLVSGLCLALRDRQRQA